MPGLNLMYFWWMIFFRGFHRIHPRFNVDYGINPHTKLPDLSEEHGKQFLTLSHFQKKSTDFTVIYRIQWNPQFSLSFQQVNMTKDHLPRRVTNVSVSLTVLPSIKIGSDGYFVPVAALDTGELRVTFERRVQNHPMHSWDPIQNYPTKNPQVDLHSRRRIIHK